MWGILLIITDALKWLLQIRKEDNDSIRISYEGIAAMYDRLVKTIEERLQETDSKLKATMIEFDLCRKGRFISEAKIADLNTRIITMQLQINMMEKELASIKSQPPF